MENNELKFYWYPSENTDGVKFEMNKEFVLSEIKRVLSEKNKVEINGFFINFGISKGENIFNRIIIKNEDNGQFSEVIEYFSYPDFEFIRAFERQHPNFPDSITYSEESRVNVGTVTKMLNRFRNKK